MGTWTALVVVAVASVGCLSAPTATSLSSPPSPPLSVPITSVASRVSNAASVSSSSEEASEAPPPPPPPHVLVSTGLVNCGNTCYLSAQLQGAFHIPRVRSVLMGDIAEPQGPASSRGGGDEEEGTRSECAAVASTTESSTPPSVARQSLRQLFRDMSAAAAAAATSPHGGGGTAAATATVTSPLAFCRALGIPVGEQQDSQEFWKLLLPAVNLPELTDLYQGAYEDYIVALDGSGRDRRREEAFLDLSLDVKPANQREEDDDSHSVLEGLQALFGRPERLSAAEGNGWRPERGADPVDAHKGSQLRAQGLPPILQLHLKRFQYDYHTDATRKLNDPVSFPLALDLTEWCQNADSTRTSDDKALLYDLQAVVVHAGEYGSGHYYAYVRPDISSDRWYRFNDHVVEEVPYRDVYADARGGKRPSDPDGAGDDDDAAANREASNTRKGWFGRLWGRVSRASLSAKDPYGYGGHTSNAYVLQYVKRSDIPLLYGS